MSNNTQIINQYCQGNQSQGRQSHQKDIQLYKCAGHTDAFPKWGCRVIIDGVLRGHVMDCINTRVAREGACKQAARALGLIEEDEDEEEGDGDGEDEDGDEDD